MNPVLTKSIIALAPLACWPLRSARIFLRVKAVSTLLQLLGATGIVLVAVTHICEGLHLLPRMNWGLENSAGHYLDLASALVGITLFPIGYLALGGARREQCQYPRTFCLLQPPLVGRAS